MTTPRHLPEGCLLGTATALAVLLGLSYLPACPVQAQLQPVEAASNPASKPVSNPYTLTLLGRTSSATSLGYDDPSYGLALWHERAGERLTLRTELTATTADKPSTGDGIELAYSALVEQRFDLGDGWWIGPGVEYTQDHAGGAERWTVGAGYSDETAAGVGQAFALRIFGEDSTPYQTHGAMLRWQALRGRWTWAVEFTELAFTLPDDSRSWGRRYTALVGLRFTSGGAR